MKGFRLFSLSFINWWGWGLFDDSNGFAARHY